MDTYKEPNLDQKSSVDQSSSSLTITRPNAQHGLAFPLGKYVKQFYFQEAL